ncbi:hypothetical protein O7627_10375 [Solwaraspora sp. WMMD1047]|uniref:hypothetical protein n=1 Tax=Solwaraspora sp. WMMD1047 TaxID=3016102 RepID=UPI002416B1F3|nr:hypothetical protein [Solwaraspora sp. WMMD1047]MDG4829708.1 hypothetical protein [Solwaraspora sp. WMMD1047]
MAVVERSAQHGTDILLRTVDNRLTGVRAGLGAADLDLAERIAACLRELVIGTTSASAADRARVRAAVHHFALRQPTRGGHPTVRSLAATRAVVNRIVLQLGRPDLIVDSGREGPVDPARVEPTPDVSDR